MFLHHFSGNYTTQVNKKGFFFTAGLCLFFFLGSWFTCDEYNLLDDDPPALTICHDTDCFLCLAPAKAGLPSSEPIHLPIIGAGSSPVRAPPSFS
jgi:hypothetical protein